MSNQFETHYMRLANLRRRGLWDAEAETGVKCTYKNHPKGTNDAVILLTQSVEACCGDEKNENHAACWNCATWGYQDQWHCKCGKEHGTHKSEDLTFKGEVVKP